MPYKPEQVCAWPGCSKTSHSRYCEEHALEATRTYERCVRDPQVRKAYGQTWKRARSKYVLTHPFCERCYEEGHMKLVDEVHHIVPVRLGGTHDPSNLMSLCKSCHTKIHEKMGDRHDASTSMW